MKVAVIGGGWAGIAAAVELTAAGQPATLFEAGRRLGGRARSVEVDGRTLDNGQHILLGAYGEALALMRQVGADPEALLLRLPLQVADNAGFRMALPRLPAPFNLAWGLLTARGVGLGEILRTAHWMQALKGAAFRLPTDTTAAAWLDSAGQTGRLRRHLWEPLCLAALNTPAERASAQVFANVLRDSLGSQRRDATDLLLPRSDLSQLLPIPAAAWLQKNGADIRLSCRVRSLKSGDGGISVDGETFDAAILAAAPQHATQLLPETRSHFDYEPIATLYLAYSPQTRLDFPMLALQGGLGQWVIDRGQGLMACVLSGHGPWEDLKDHELAGCLHAELGFPDCPSWHKVVREKRATFSCRPNLPRPGPATGDPRIWLAGDITWADYPATLEGAVRSGRRAARAILTSRSN